MILRTEKNPAYGRHLISQQVWIVEPIQKNHVSCVVCQSSRVSQKPPPGFAKTQLKNKCFPKEKFFPPSEPKLQPLSPLSFKHI